MLKTLDNTSIRIEKNSLKQIPLSTVFVKPKEYNQSKRINMLAKHKDIYHGKDFF
jgi:hypothetical protein